MSILCKTEKVVFSDGSVLIVQEESWDCAMLLEEMERQARENPSDDPKTQLFRQMFYPKLAACSSGDVPSEEEARAMPSEQLDKWYEAAKRVNPKWFAAIVALTKEAEKAEEKKRTKRPQKSVNGSKVS